MRTKPLFALLALAALCVIAQAQTMPIQIFEGSQSAPLWKEKGDGLSAQGRFEEAVQSSDKALELNPRDADAWANKARFLMALERYEEAISADDNALRLCGQ